MQFYTIGIDPGQTGAIALLRPDGTGAVDDIPMLGDELDAVQVAALLDHGQAEMPVHIYLEQSRAMTKPGQKPQGVSSVFKYGRTYGEILSQVKTSRIPFTRVQANVWKKVMGLSGPKVHKDKARQLACSLYPFLADRLSRKCDHNRAESILIAHYGKGLQS